jgi:hypothetical protein
MWEKHTVLHFHLDKMQGTQLRPKMFFLRWVKITLDWHNRTIFVSFCESVVKNNYIFPVLCECLAIAKNVSLILLLLFMKQ